VLKLVRRAGVLRPRDVKDASITRVHLRRMVASGLLENPGRGLYVLAGARPTEHQGLAEACKRVPHGVVCLLSALQFHELTTQAPFEVWLAIGASARAPKVDHPPLRIVRFSKASLEFGVLKRRIDGVSVRVTSPAKTVADCFKFRNKIGLDVALEALRECLRRRKATMDELHLAAAACRVARVIRPYLEAMA
jgi:predicted transcriptional regulator of viral defense system